MPNIKSQKKRVLTNAKAEAANKSVRAELRTELKKTAADAAEGKADVAKAMSTIDKAARKGAISKNSANRKKSIVSREAQKKD
ncbi:MAG: 30S ribosomal protein S20 [Oscillospiraceae bacterium]|jgi:small subunit ribosomal protein S20